MGAETIIYAIIVGAFAAFIVFVGYVDYIANAKAITAEEEQAARLAAVPVKAKVKVAEFKQAA